MGYHQRKHSLPVYYFITGDYNIQHSNLFCRSYDNRYQSFINIYYISRLHCRSVMLSILAFQLSTFILGLIFLSPFFILEYVTVPPVEFDTKTVFSILYVGVFASLSAFVLWNKAIMTVDPSKAGMIYYTLPLFSGLLAYLVLKEDISIIHFYSMLLIVSGILTANYESKKVQQDK